MSGLQAERDDLFEECKNASKENHHLRVALGNVWDLVFKNVSISDFDGMPEAYEAYKTLRGGDNISVREKQGKAK